MVIIALSCRNTFFLSFSVIYAKLPTVNLLVETTLTPVSLFAIVPPYILKILLLPISTPVAVFIIVPSYMVNVPAWDVSLAICTPAKALQLEEIRPPVPQSLSVSAPAFLMTITPTCGADVTSHFPFRQRFTSVSISITPPLLVTVFPLYGTEPPFISMVSAR